MRKSAVFCLAAGALASPAMPGSAQGVIDSMGFWYQAEGTLTACDTNPFFGSPDQMPFNDDPDVPWGVDLDPSYDWAIVESMVCVPAHPWPFFLWPSNAPNGGVPFGTHEMGYAMGIILIFEDTNGFDPSDWGRGRLLLITNIGMNHQEMGMSGLSWWTEMVGDLPWRNLFIGSALMESSGPWADEYGPGWIIEGNGLTTSMREWVGIRRLDWYTKGWMHAIRFQSISQRHGDMNLNGRLDFGDVFLFMAAYIGGDHDETRMLLADYTGDGFVRDDDFWMFMDDLLRSG